MAGAVITKGARDLCAAGLRSALATQSVQRIGLRPVLSHIAGGYAAWKEAGGPVQEKARR